MRKIEKLLKDEESVLVFDIDGVLALLEFDDYHHFYGNDKEWYEECSRGVNHYTEDKAIKKMQDFFKTKKDMSRIYVITAIGHNNESEFKKEFANKYYNIPKENVYFVQKNSEKKEKLIEIKNNYPDIEDYRIVMIDDTISILNDIMENTKFSTVHISSFLDI